MQEKNQWSASIAGLDDMKLFASSKVNVAMMAVFSILGKKLRVDYRGGSC